MLIGVNRVDKVCYGQYKAYSYHRTKNNGKSAILHTTTSHKRDSHKKQSNKANDNCKENSRNHR